MIRWNLPLGVGMFRRDHQRPIPFSWIGELRTLRLSLQRMRHFIASLQLHAGFVDPVIERIRLIETRSILLYSSSPNILIRPKFERLLPRRNGLPKITRLSFLRIKPLPQGHPKAKMGSRTLWAFLQLLLPSFQTTIERIVRCLKCRPRIERRHEFL